ncbi:hypothetical protein Fmac_013499 [Flemingia macrophylla]|uniref:Uncharacterized protein n=1 Tax=Flemingia macrophylla TaxID=520843 RepID=A0ABD1MTB4_9FABA
MPFPLNETPSTFLHRPKEHLRGFLESDEQIIDLLIWNPCFLYDGRFPSNFKLLLGVGITHSNIDILLKRWPNILCSTNLLKTFQELKQMGFDISTSTFCIAFLAKRAVNKTKWEEEEILTLLRVMVSVSSSLAGFDFMILVKALGIFLPSLRKRIAGWALVVKFLTLKGLLQKDACMPHYYAIGMRRHRLRYCQRHFGGTFTNRKNTYT